MSNDASKRIWLMQTRDDLRAEREELERRWHAVTAALEGIEVLLAVEPEEDAAVSTDAR